VKFSVYRAQRCGSITHQATRGAFYQNYLVPDVRSIYTRYCSMHRPSALAELLTSS